MRILFLLALSMASSAQLSASPSSEQALKTYFLQEDIAFDFNDQLHSATLFLPLKGFLKSIPMGFSICSNIFENGALAEVAMTPEPQGFTTPQIEIEHQCISIANPMFAEDTLMQLEIEQGESTIKLTHKIRPKTGLVYKERVFRMLQASKDMIATVFYPTLSPAASSYAIVCSHKPAQLVGLYSRPFGSNQDFAPIQDITVLNEFCSEVRQYVWNEGFWENLYEFSTENNRIRLIEHVEK